MGHHRPRSLGAQVTCSSTHIVTVRTSLLPCLPGRLPVAALLQRSDVSVGGEWRLWIGGRSEWRDVYRVTSISALLTPPGPPGMLSESRRKVCSRRLHVLMISTYLSNGSAE